MDSIDQALAVSRARVAILNLTIEDARKAKTAIEAKLTTWESDHPYTNQKVCNLAAIVGAPGVATWLAHFHTASGMQLPDLVFEIDEHDHVALAAQLIFSQYQFQQEGGEA